MCLVRPSQPPGAQMPFCIPRPRRPARPAGTAPCPTEDFPLARFGRDESGGMILFSLFILIAMLIAVGMAIDTARVELARTKLQTITDNAILAAADLEQSLDSKTVVKDYFKKAGLEQYLKEPQVVSGVNHRTVSAEANIVVPTFFMDMVGIETLTAPAIGTATESMSDIEIALVLDNSGSMDDTTPTRISLLKPAARDFIDAVTRQEGEPGTTSISIIPFATQVNAGAALLDRMSVTDEHDYSHCVTFDAGDFGTTSVAAYVPTSTAPASDTLDLTAHFDADSESYVVSETRMVCPQASSRTITPWSTNADYLKGRINEMSVYGWTSIEIGTKWGAAMLDPSMRPVLNSLVSAGVVESDLQDQPFDYTRDNTMKILVVMSDGENTRNYDIKAPFRSGPSPIYRYNTSSGSPRYSYYYDRSGTDNDYFDFQDWRWESKPYGGDDAYRHSWPDLWEDMSVEYFLENYKDNALGNYAYPEYDDIVARPSKSTKNDRTSEICTAVKNRGVTIFTIGMDTYGQGDATLEDCATTTDYFYDVQSLDISAAFASIARQINQLRLTQ